ncbi:hypothetical protein HA402_009499 [Bradysia odoriphaga]|nr:hypothetical protein HA402_009499 [Bradysia odoriphaga]
MISVIMNDVLSEDQPIIAGYSGNQKRQSEPVNNTIQSVYRFLFEEAIIYEATEVCSLSYVQTKVVQFAIEALEKHGVTQDAATEIREKCMAIFKRFKAWDCIIGNENFKHSLSQDITGKEYAS